MRVVITGASGLVGTALVSELKAAGHEVQRLVRRPARSPEELEWAPQGSEMPLAARNGLEGADAVVHLAGANVAQGRWSRRRKHELEASRVVSTDLLARTLADLDRKPATLICASASGIYGNRGSAWVDSNSLPGSGFLAAICRDWEAAADPARAAGIRVAHMRFGIILDPKRGALAKMMQPFRFGLGATLGNGSQFISWIAIDDAVGAILHVLEEEGCSGPIDAVAPHPATNLEFTTALAGVFKHKARLRFPKVAVRILFGEKAEELFLSGNRVRPTALLRTGYQFKQPELVQSLRLLLNRPKQDWFELLEE